MKIQIPFLALTLLTTMTARSAVSLVEIEAIKAQAYTGTGNGSTGKLSEFLDGHLGAGPEEGLTKVDPDDISTWTHGLNWQEGWQGTNLSTGGHLGWVVVDFGLSVTVLDELYLWNVTEPGSGPQSRGTETFNLWYADTPTSAVPSSGDYDFHTPGWTQLNVSALTLAIGGSDKLYDGVFDLSGISSARYLGIEILTNYGSDGSPDAPNRNGLAEIVVTAVPEPSVAALALLGTLGALVRRRR